MNQTLCFGTDGGCLDSFYLFKELYPDQKISFLSNDHERGITLYDSYIQGPFEEIFKIKEECNFIYQCGSVLNHKSRDSWFMKAVDNGFRPISLISKFSYVHSSAEIGSGSIIYPGVKIMPNVKIGINTIILPNSVINHDAIIDDFSIINSSCVINGSVSIGKKCYLGSNTSIKEKVKIPDEITVGMNSMILSNIAQKGIYFGSPVKKKFRG